MDLDNIKNKWNKISEFSEENPPLGKQQLQKITRSNYTKNIIKIAVPEILFSLIYLYFLAFFVNFDEYFVSHTHTILRYLAIILLIALPILSLTNVYLFYKTGKLINSYNEALKSFKQQCERFNKLQYLIISLNIILLLICVILVPRVYSEILSNTQMAIAFLISGLFVVVCSFKIWKFYRKQIKRNEELIENLGQN